MKSFLNTTAILIIFLITSYQTFAGKSDELQKMIDFQESFQPYVSAYNATHDQTFVNNWLNLYKEFKAFQEKFNKTYGTDLNKIKEEFAEAAKKLNKQGYLFTPLELMQTDIEKKNSDVASWLLNEGKENYNKWEKYTPPNPEKYELKYKYADRALTKIKASVTINKTDEASELLKKAEKAYSQSAKEWKKNLKQVKWPGHNPEFQGKQAPAKLADAAISFLKKLKKEGKQWSKPEYDDVHIPQAACVVGSDWAVAKKAPITGAPTQYSVKMYVAFQGEKDKDVSYGYYMHFYTEEKAGVKPELPFKYCNSETYACSQILSENVPAQGSSSAGGGFFGFIFTILLSASLLAAAMIMCEKLITTKLPQTAKLSATLKDNGALVGLAAISIAKLAFLRTLLFHFAPFSDIVPQLAAFIAGLLLTAKFKENLPEKVKAKIDQFSFSKKLLVFAETLIPNESVIGYLALLTGLIHLIPVSLPLF